MHKDNGSKDKAFSHWKDPVDWYARAKVLGGWQLWCHSQGCQNYTWHIEDGPKEDTWKRTVCGTVQRWPRDVGIEYAHDCQT